MSFSSFLIKAIKSFIFAKRFSVKIKSKFVRIENLQEINRVLPSQSPEITEISPRREELLIWLEFLLLLRCSRRPRFRLYS